MGDPCCPLLPVRDRCDTDPARTELRNESPVDALALALPSRFTPVYTVCNDPSRRQARTIPHCLDDDATWLLYSYALLLTGVP